MIDPKLNEIPVEGGKAATGAPLTETEVSERQRRSRSGLSINDTIAGDTLLSSGSRGVDTSGVAAGSGAGGGLSSVTPGASASAAPNIVPGSRGSGTTVRGGANTAELAGSPSSNLFDPDGPSTLTATSTSTSEHSHFIPESGSSTPNTLEVAQRAYEIWCAKGCPEGTADQDWHEAERELTSANRGGLTRAANI